MASFAPLHKHVSVLVLLLQLVTVDATTYFPLTSPVQTTQSPSRTTENHETTAQRLTTLVTTTSSEPPATSVAVETTVVSTRPDTTATRRTTTRLPTSELQTEPRTSEFQTTTESRTTGRGMTTQGPSTVQTTERQTSKMSTDSSTVALQQTTKLSTESGTTRGETTDSTTTAKATSEHQTTTVRETTEPTTARTTLTTRGITSASTSARQTLQTTSNNPTTDKPTTSAATSSAQPQPTSSQPQPTPTTIPTERSTTTKPGRTPGPSTARRTTTRLHTTSKTPQTDTRTKLTTKNLITTPTYRSTTGDEGASDTGGSTSVALILTLTLLFLALIVIIILAFLYLRRHHTDSGDVNVEAPTERGFPRVASFMTATLKREQTVVRNVNNNDNYRRSMHFNRGNLALLDIIGRGSYTQVMTGQAWKVIDDQTVSTVAVKMLRDDARELDKARLISELETMRKLLDPPRNIISLLGYCKDEDPVYIIYERAERGSLQSYLRGIREEYYSDDSTGDRSKIAPILLRFIEEIGQGLGYLHSMNVVHGDICSLSILITDDLVIKISDIGKQPTDKSGKCRTLDKYSSLPVRWMSPEMQRGELSAKSDIWAYGVVMWEIATLGATPYFTLSWGEEVIVCVKKGGRLEKPEHCSQDLYNTMMKCWTDDSKQRPACKTIIRKSQQFTGNQSDLLNMEEFNPNLYEIIKTPSRDEKF